MASAANPSILSRAVGGSEIVLSLESSDPNTLVKNDSKALSVRIGSSFMRSAESRYAMLLNNGIFTQQAYNLSLGIGYSGFRLGASFSRNENRIAADLSGYDVGIGYFADRWSANLRMAEYNRTNSILLNSEYDVFDTISAYELGAAYRLFPNISLTGRFTYYSYGAEVDSLAIEDVKSLMFGTNVSF
nr:porin [Pseudemcibacter aquimaris]